MWNVYVNRLIACAFLMQLLMILSKSSSYLSRPKLITSHRPRPTPLARQYRRRPTTPHYASLQNLHVPNRRDEVQIL